MEKFKYAMAKKKPGEVSKYVAYEKIELSPEMEELIKDKVTEQAKIAVEQQVKKRLERHLVTSVETSMRTLCSATVPSLVVFTAVATYLTSIGYMPQNIGVPFVLVLLVLLLAFLRGWRHAQASRL